MEDCKLDAVFYGQTEQPLKNYGSKEDDDDALRSLVAIEETTQNQPREYYATMIMKFLGKLSDVQFKMFYHFSYNYVGLSMGLLLN